MLPCQLLRQSRCGGPSIPSTLSSVFPVRFCDSLNPSCFISRVPSPTLEDEVKSPGCTALACQKLQKLLAAFPASGSGLIGYCAQRHCPCIVLLGDVPVSHPYRIPINGSGRKHALLRNYEHVPVGVGKAAVAHGDTGSVDVDGIAVLPSSAAAAQSRTQSSRDTQSLNPYPYIWNRIPWPLHPAASALTPTTVHNLCTSADHLSLTKGPKWAKHRPLGRH